jgi:hypothetical protein
LASTVTLVVEGPTFRMMGTETETVERISTSCEYLSNPSALATR